MSRATLLPIIVIVTAVTALASPPDTRPGVVVRVYDIGRDVYALPEMPRGQLPNVAMVVATIDLNPGDFGGLEDRFVTEVEGMLKINIPGEYHLRLISDDGSKLWIDDKPVIDHDGPHGAVPKDAAIRLDRGEHALRIRHFEAGGGERLALHWVPPDAEQDDDFEPVPVHALVHDASASLKTEPGTKRIIPPLRRGGPGDGKALLGAHPSFDFTRISQLTPSAELSQMVRDGRIGVIGASADTAAGEVLVWAPSDMGAVQDVIPQTLSGDQYADQLVLWSAQDGECKRASLEAGQGCVFRFAVIGPSTFEYNGKATFEMLTVRAMTNGLEIEFSNPLDPRVGWEADSYYVEQWPFDVGNKGAKGQSDKEGRPDGDGAYAPYRDGIRYAVKSASVSADRRKVFLEIPDLKPSHVVYLRLLPPCISEDGELPWSTEAWYTLNAIPAGRAGTVLPPPPAEPQNFLTDAEKAEGWRLLFDGKTTAGWRGYRKDDMPDGWQAVDGCLVRVGPAGDICTTEQFDNFELKIDWRISAGGNSGVFWRVSESKGAPYETGPEMQVLDNSTHNDGKNTLTSAGSDYALYAPTRDVTEPIGFFNRVRIRVDGADVTYWLNDEQIVDYELWTDDWKQRVAASKFKAWPGYGLQKKGHLVVQDHGDQVWYRNIKIRPLVSGTE